MFRMARFLASTRGQLQLRVSGRFSQHFPVTNQVSFETYWSSGDVAIRKGERLGRVRCYRI